MAVFRRKFRDQKTGKLKPGAVWWYKFYFSGQLIRESAKTSSKTLAKQAEQKRRRELEEGFNGIIDRREDRIRTIADLADTYLEAYQLRSRSVTFAEYALSHLKRHLGKQMAVEITEKTVRDYQTARLKEEAAPKTINEEVGFLLRLLGEQGDAIRTKLRRQKALKLGHPVGHRQSVYGRREGFAVRCGQKATLESNLSRPGAYAELWASRQGAS